MNSIDYLVKIYEVQAGPLAHVDERRLADFVRTKTQFKKFEAHARVFLSLKIF